MELRIAVRDTKTKLWETERPSDSPIVQPAEASRQACIIWHQCRWCKAGGVQWDPERGTWKCYEDSTHKGNELINSHDAEVLLRWSFTT